MIEHVTEFSELPECCANKLHKRSRRSRHLSSLGELELPDTTIINYHTAVRSHITILARGSQFGPYTQTSNTE